MKVICISGKAQNGKDTTAGFMKEILEARGNRVLIAHFGDLVKYICKTFFDWDGKKDERGRTLLQYVGTDKIRAVWDYVLIPDCRFPNEYEIFKHYGFDAVLLRVERPDFVSPLTPEQQAHRSETALDGYPYDFTIVNNGDLMDLRLGIDMVLEVLDKKMEGKHEAVDNPV